MLVVLAWLVVLYGGNWFLEWSQGQSNTEWNGSGTYLDECGHGSGQCESGVVHGHQSVLASVDDAHLASLVLFLSLIIRQNPIVILVLVWKAHCKDTSAARLITCWRRRATWAAMTRWRSAINVHLAHMQSFQRQ